MSLKYSFSHSFSHKTSLISVAILFILVSCLPSQQPTSQLRSAVNSNGSETPVPVATFYKEPNFPLPDIFIQEGLTKTSINFPIAQNFSDSFLLRGLSLSTELKKLPNTTKICLIANFNISTKNYRLILSGKPKSFTDLVNKTTENYLLIEPANDVANQNDCLSQGLLQTLTTNSTDTFNFSLNQICNTAGCSSPIQSSPLLLYLSNGEKVPNIDLNTLKMTVTGTFINQTNLCTGNDTCRARNFDCCLDSQCVMDGALKGINNPPPEFFSAQEDVKNNPGRFTLYPQFYFVCQSRPEDPAPGSGPVSNTDTLYNAYINLLELKHLHDCLNPMDGEISYCTRKIPSPDNSNTHSALKDDINFSTINSGINDAALNNDNIVKVIYGGQILIDNGKVVVPNSVQTTENNNSDPLTQTLESENDDLNAAQQVKIIAPLSPTARDANLYITYKIDGSCTKINNSLARCTKTYVQGQTSGPVSYFHDSTSQIFKLPPYANLTADYPILVKVDGITKPEDPDIWTRDAGTQSITFPGDNKILTNQKVEITYFSTIAVNGNGLSISPNIVESKTLAQTEVNKICSCAGTNKCNLKPKLDDNKNIVNFECVYPVPQSNDPPANQVVYISTKNAPHRFFDGNGLGYDQDISAATSQEGTDFNYNLNNLMKPTNLDTYTGFNEIYGSFKTASPFNFYKSQPAKMVRVKKDQVYDIIVTNGNFAGCSDANCGRDYYQNKLLFPPNTSGNGGGYIPNYLESSRLDSSSLYRSDDLLFGRACFIPATMIPWTHKNITASEALNTQRKNRLAAQHFLFANGYQRDWFGFDYGSVIGSFNGVTWFSIGNQRRIKATTSKLYLAVNAYFSDLNSETSFIAAVSEMNPFSSPIPEHDSESDGAECQRAHYCTNDKDCFANLGYDYTCQEIPSLMTEWPIFDANATEVRGSIRKSLSSIIGGYNGQSKRCVYRGRGAPCHEDLAEAVVATNPKPTFNSTKIIGTLACSTNNHCRHTKTGDHQKFNNKISRYGAGPLKQNLTDIIEKSDTHGLGARVLGRPYNYFGNVRLPTEVVNFSTNDEPNDVQAICIPGKNLTAVNTFQLSTNDPGTPAPADKILGIGVTPSTWSAQFYSSCPAVNSEGKAIHYLPTQNLTDAEIKKATISQNLSTNLLDSLVNGIFATETGGRISSFGYSKNACLRGAGATCFSDLDCGPSTYIAEKAKLVPNIINEAEKKFWEEELVCGNPEIKYPDNTTFNPNFDSKQNRCCRESGKVLTTYTETGDAPIISWCASGFPNIINSGSTTIPAGRYSRVNTAYDKITCDVAEVSSSKPFALSLNSFSQATRYQQIKYQYNALDTVNSRTCCTTHWVRSFDTSNGGGNTQAGREFNRGKGQKLNLEMFKHINWQPDVEPTPPPDPLLDSAFSCSDDGISHTTSYCEIMEYDYQGAKDYLDFASSLELLGIPQVPIKTKDQISKLVNDVQQEVGTDKIPLDHVYSQAGFDPATSEPTTPGYSQLNDFRDENGNRMYSAANVAKFDIKDGGLKKIFKENEFNCCIPSGQVLPNSVTPQQCCTGFISYLNPTQPNCCLPDYADVSVYLNRYVSSEGRGLPESSYDPATGYLKDPGMVMSVARQKSLCCSGQMATGVVLSYLPVPIGANADQLYPAGSPSAGSMRFLYRTDGFDNASDYGSILNTYNAGRKLNNHVYCVPQGTTN